MEDRELNPKTDCFHPKSGEDHVQHWVADWLRTAVARNIEEINKSFSHTPMAQNLVEFEKDVFDARAFFAAKKIDDTIVRGDQSQTKSAIDSAFFSSPEPWQRLETACRVNDFLNDRKSHGLTTPGFRAMVGQTVDGLDLRSMQVDTPLYDRPENVISEKPQNWLQWSAQKASGIGEELKKIAAAKKFLDCLGDPQNKDKDSFFLAIARAQHPQNPDAPYIDFR